MSPLDEKQLAAELRLARALDPTTPHEMRTVAWLQGWDTDTMDSISTMIERRNGAAS